MWIREITISNYKAIREMNISFRPSVNLLIGDNGVGKTSILEAITVAFGDFINGMSGVAKKGILSSDVRIDTKMISDASQGIVHYTPITIRTVFNTEEGEKIGSQKQDLAEKKFRTMQMKKRTIWTKNFHCFAITVQPDLHRPKEKILEQ